MGRHEETPSAGTPGDNVTRVVLPPSELLNPGQVVEWMRQLQERSHDAQDAQ